MQRRSLKKLLLVILIASFTMANKECTGNAPPFKWNPLIYVGDSETQSMVREDAAGNIEQLMCKDPRFDEMVAMHKSEIKNVKQAYFEVVDQCEKWKSPQSQDDAYQYGIQLFGELP